jgi:uncharacterized SAM-binding protein YcdF (DUF218 family)
VIGHSFVKPLISPPGNLMVLGFIGWLVKKRRKLLGRTLMLFAAVAFYLLTTPLVSIGLLESLQQYPALDPEHLPEGCGAIVVLGGDQRVDATEFGVRETLSMLSLERVRYAAFLARRTGLPVLTTGGYLRPSQAALANQMKHVLETEFGVEARWAEDGTRDTWDNATFSKAILEREGIRRIFVVTHAWHMPRSVFSFEKAGFEVVPAPTAFRRLDGLDLVDFLPSSRALHDSQLALHEWLGGIWYEVQYGWFGK